MGDDGAIVHDEARVVGLGKGLGDHGLFAPDRIVAASEVVGDYAATARDHGIVENCLLVGDASSIVRATERVGIAVSYKHVFNTSSASISDSFSAPRKSWYAVRMRCSRSIWSLESLATSR